MQRRDVCGRLLVGLLLVGLLAACDNTPAATSTPAGPASTATAAGPASTATAAGPASTATSEPPTATALPPIELPTPIAEATIIGPALKPGDPLTFRAALLKAWPDARTWHPDALLILASLVTTPASPAAGSWNFTFASTNGKERRLILVSSTDLQAQSISGVVEPRILQDISKNADQVDKLLDSPALQAKVEGLGYTFTDKEQIKMVYYVSGENINITNLPHSVVQVRLLKGDNAVQLVMDAVTGDLLQKLDNSGG